jgi:hypothetical protein
LCPVVCLYYVCGELIMSAVVNAYILDVCHKISGPCKWVDCHTVVSVRFLDLPYDCKNPGTRVVIFRPLTWHSIKLHLAIHSKCHLQVLLSVQTLPKQEQLTCDEQEIVLTF